RALAVDPQVLLLEEPFGALDAKVRDDLRRWLRRLHDEVHVTTVLVTHDQEEALDVADRIAVLNAGRIEQVGSPDELYEQPANPFVMSFLGSVSRLNGEIARPHDLRIERDRQVAITEAERTGVRVTEARVERLVRLGFEVRIELSHTTTGDQFFAQLTRAEASGLALTVGDVVWVLPTHTLGTGLPALAGEEEFPALAV
ncbi:MAG: sulfate ABC transporter ATP-binding protein, partial [Propionibacteriaceae bacterium]|nr:sulfate ABC transporter ATP-binding protein [Propionibacteriaceae bacterium]